MFGSFTKNLTSFINENILEENNPNPNQPPNQNAPPQRQAQTLPRPGPGTAGTRSPSSMRPQPQDPKTLPNPRNPGGPIPHQPSFPSSKPTSRDPSPAQRPPQATGPPASGGDSEWGTQEKLLIEHLGLNANELKGMTKFELIQIAAVHAEMKQQESGAKTQPGGGPCIESMLLAQIVDIPGLTQNDLMMLSPKEIAKIAAVNNQSNQAVSQPPPPKSTAAKPQQKPTPVKTEPPKTSAPTKANPLASQQTSEKPKGVWDSLSNKEKKKLEEMGLNKEAVSGLSKMEVDQILSVMVESENPNSTGSKNPSRESSRASSPTRGQSKAPLAMSNPQFEKNLAAVSSQVSKFFDTKSEQEKREIELIKIEEERRMEEERKQKELEEAERKLTKEKEEREKPSPVQRQLTQEQKRAEERMLENERRLAEQQRLLEEEIKAEEERLRAEEERRQAEQRRRKEMQEKFEAERRRLEEERREEEERWRREEEERIRREEEERIRREEEERRRKEEEERLRREEEERRRREEEERLRREEEERKRKEEEERLRREEEERRRREEEERLRREEEERIRREEEERIRREEEERLRREEEERIRREQEVEEERLRQEAAEKARLAEEERLRVEAEKRRKEEEEERLRREEEERIRREREEERMRQEHEERLWREEQERRQMKIREEEERRAMENRASGRKLPGDRGMDYDPMPQPPPRQPTHNQRAYQQYQEQEQRRNKYNDVEIYFSDEEFESDVYSEDEEGRRGRQGHTGWGHHGSQGQRPKIVKPKQRPLPPGLTEADVAGLSPEELDMIMAVMARAEEDGPKSAPGSPSKDKNQGAPRTRHHSEGSSSHSIIDREYEQEYGMRQTQGDPSINKSRTQNTQQITHTVPNFYSGDTEMEVAYAQGENRGMGERERERGSSYNGRTNVNYSNENRDVVSMSNFQGSQSGVTTTSAGYSKGAEVDFARESLPTTTPANIQNNSTINTAAGAPFNAYGAANSTTSSFPPAATSQQIPAISNEEFKENQPPIITQSSQYYQQQPLQESRKLPGEQKQSYPGFESRDGSIGTPAGQIGQNYDTSSQPVSYTDPVNQQYQQQQQPHFNQSGQQDPGAMNPVALLRATAGDETAANFGKIIEKANSAFSTFADDFTKGMNYAGDQYGNMDPTMGPPQSTQSQLQPQSESVPSEKLCGQCGVRKLNQSSEECTGHFCAVCLNFVCLQCCKLVTNQNNKRKEWLCLHCHKGVPRAADQSKLAQGAPGQGGGGSLDGTNVGLQGQNPEENIFDQKTSAVNLSLQRTQKELKKQGSAELLEKQKTPATPHTSQPEISTTQESQQTSQNQSSVAFEDFDPNAYLAQLDANWSADTAAPVAFAEQDLTISATNQNSSANHVITWSSSSSWKPKQGEESPGQQQPQEPPQNLLITQAQQARPTDADKSPSRIMPPLPKSSGFPSQAKPTVTSTTAPSSAQSQASDWSNNEPMMSYNQNKQKGASAQNQAYGIGNESSSYFDEQFDEAADSYYDYQSYTQSGYYDQYGNWVHSTSPVANQQQPYPMHQIETQNDYENIMEPGFGGQTPNAHPHKLFDRDTSFDMPSGVISERPETDTYGKSGAKDPSLSQPIYENMTQEVLDSYSQELMDMIQYQDSSGEEETSDVEIIEEGSIGRYNTFTNLSTAKEKKGPGGGAGEGEGQEDLTGQEMPPDIEEMDPDSSNFVQYQQEQEISAALAKVGRHPRTPLCTLVESSEEDEEMSEFGKRKKAGNGLSIPKRPTRSEMLEKLEKFQTGIEQKTGSADQKIPSAQQQARKGQIIRIDAPKSGSGFDSKPMHQTQAQPVKGVLKNGANYQQNLQSRMIPPAPLPPAVTTTGQTSLYYRLAKDMISEHYHIGKSNHSSSLANKLDIGQTPLNNGSSQSTTVTTSTATRMTFKSTSADTSDLTSWSNNLKQSGPGYYSESYTLPGGSSHSERTQTVSSQFSSRRGEKCTISTQTTENGSTDIVRYSSIPGKSSRGDGSTSGGSVIKEKRVKFFEKRTWSLPETEEDLEVGSRSLAVNVERVLIRSSSWEELNEQSETIVTPVKKPPPPPTNTAPPPKSKRPGGKRILPQPDPGEVEMEMESSRFPSKSKARPLRTDEVDILRKRLLHSNKSSDSRRNLTIEIPSSSSKYESNSLPTSPLHSILKKDKSYESKNRKAPSASISVQANMEEGRSYGSSSSGRSSRRDVPELVVNYSSDRHRQISPTPLTSRAGLTSSADSKYEQYKAEVELLPKRKFSAEEGGTEDELLRQLKNKIRYLENCKRENFEIQTGMTLKTGVEAQPQPQLHRLGSPRHSPDPSRMMRNPAGPQFPPQSSTFLTIPSQQKVTGRVSPRSVASPVVYLEEPNPQLKHVRKKLHHELRFLVDDLQRRQLTEARRALTSITTQKTTDLEKYAYPKGKGLVWVAAQSVKPRVSNEIPASPMPDPNIPASPEQIQAHQAAVAAGYQVAQSVPDQIIVTPGFAGGVPYVSPPPTVFLPPGPLTQLPSYAPAVGDLILSASLGNKLFSDPNAAASSRVLFDPNSPAASTAASFLSTRDRFLLSPGRVLPNRFPDSEFDNLRRNRTVLGDTNGFVPSYYNLNQPSAFDPFYQRNIMTSALQQPDQFSDPFGIRALNPGIQDPATIKRDSKLELIASLQQQLDDLYRVELYRSAVDGSNQIQQTPATSLGNSSINELKKSIDQRWQQLDQSSTLLRNLSANRLAQTLGTNVAASQSPGGPNFDMNQTQLDPSLNLSTIYDPFPVKDSVNMATGAQNVIVEEIPLESGSIISSPSQLNPLISSPVYSNAAFNQLQNTIVPMLQQSAQQQQMQDQINQQQQQIQQTQQQLQQLQQQALHIHQQQNEPIPTDPSMFNLGFQQNQPGVQGQMMGNAVFDQNKQLMPLTPLQQHQQQAFSLTQKDTPDFSAGTMPRSSQATGVIRPLNNIDGTTGVPPNLNSNPYATLSRAAASEYSSDPKWYQNNALGNINKPQNQMGSQFGGPGQFSNNIQFGNARDQKSVRSMTDLTGNQQQPPDFLERALIKPSQVSIEDLSEGYRRNYQTFLPGDQRRDGMGQDLLQTTSHMHKDHPTRDVGSINLRSLPLKTFRLSQDPKDRLVRSNGLGISIVGGKIIPETNGTKVAMIQKIFPGRVAEVLNPQLQEGDIVIEWNGVSLLGKSYEEVQHVIQSKTTGDVDIVVCPQAQAKSIMSKADRTAQMTAYTGNNAGPKYRNELDFHNIQFAKSSALNQQMGFEAQKMNQNRMGGASNNWNFPSNQRSQPSDNLVFGNQGNQQFGGGQYSTFPRGGGGGNQGMQQQQQNQMALLQKQQQQKGLWLEQDLASGAAHHSMPGGSGGGGGQYGTMPAQIGGSNAGAGGPGRRDMIGYDTHHSYRDATYGPRHLGGPGAGGGGQAAPGMMQSTDQMLSQMELVSCAEEEIRGEMQVAVAYSDQTQELVVDIIQAKGLAPPAAKPQSADPFVKVYLLPDRCPENKRRIRYTRGTLEPFWNQSVEYAYLPRNHLPRKYLELTVWDYDKMRTNTFLGEVIIDLGDYAVLDGRARWYMLTEHTDSPEAYLDRVHIMQQQHRNAVAAIEAGVHGHGHGPGGLVPPTSPMNMRKVRSHTDLETGYAAGYGGNTPGRQRKAAVNQMSQSRRGGGGGHRYDSDPEISPNDMEGRGGSARGHHKPLDGYGVPGPRSMDYPPHGKLRNLTIGTSYNFQSDDEHQLIRRMSQALSHIADHHAPVGQPMGEQQQQQHSYHHHHQQQHHHNHRPIMMQDHYRRH